MIKRLSKILTYSLLATVLAFGAFGIIKPTELKASVASVPSGYIPIPYLESDGSAWIDTGLTMTDSQDIYIIGKLSGENTSSVIYFGTSGPPIQAYNNNGELRLYNTNYSNPWDTGLTPSLDVPMSFSMHLKKNDYPTDTVNGKKFTGITAIAGWVQTGTFHLYGRHDVNQPNSHLNVGCKMRIYNFSIYNGGTALFVGIPCMRKSDSVLGMYDLASNTFKVNVGSGSFSTDSLLPSDYTEVGYLESDGSSYLNLGNPTTFLDGGFTITSEMLLPSALSAQSNNFGWDNSTTNSFTTLFSANGYFVVYVNGDYSKSINIGNFYNKPMNIIVNYSSGSLFYDLNGISYTRNNTITVADKFGLLGYYDYPNSRFNSAPNYRQGRFTVFNSSNSRVLDLIPCIRNSDGTLGMYDIVNNTFYAKQGTGSFTTDGTVYVVNNATTFTNALNNAVSGDYVIIANDITIAEQDFAFASGVNIIQNDHSITPPTVTGYGIHSYWYTNSSYTGATTTTISAGTHYYAKYLTEIAVSTLQELNTALTTATADNVIVLTANITYDSETFTNSSLAVINNISYLKAPARTTPWSFTSWQGNPATLAPNATVHASYTASVSDETRLDIAIETATQYDIIKLANNITLTSTASNHPYGNVTGNTFTTKTFDEFDMNGYSISSNAHSNWSLGYAFVDWYSTKWTVALGSGDPTENTTYYARFSITINDNSTFTYALNGAYDGDQITLGQNITPTTNAFTIPSYVTFNQNGKTITAPSKLYHTVNGWTQDNGTTIVTSFSAGHSYYANYTPETYTITYASQTGITYTLPADAITSYDYGIGGTLPIPTRTGYSFSGWYTNSNLTGQVYNSISSTDHGNKTFYSSWQKLPENISIANVNVFRNVGDDTTGKQNGIDDMLILFTYKIEWETLPTTPVDQWFTFRLMGTDNTTTIATYNPYPYNDYGYGIGVGYFYFPDASEMEWGGEYQIRIDGNPFAWYSISDLTTVRNIYSSNYSEKLTSDENRRLLTTKLVNIAHQLENDWYTGSDLAYMLIAQENNVTYLTQYGQTYFENSINHLRVFAPDLFLTTIIIPDYSEEKDSENADPASLVNRWRTQYKGTWVQDSFEAIGDLLHIPWRMATSILCMVVWIILSAISARLFGTTDAGFWSGAVVFATGVTMGIMEYTIIGAGALLIALYSLYIIFWRQG